MKKIALLLAGYAICMASAAQAATCNTTGGGSGSFSMTTASSAVCVSGGKISGNNGYFANNPTLFGLSGWTLADNNAGGGDGNILFGSAPVYETTSGNWSIANSNGYSNIMITLKAGKGFSAFQLDANALSGGWLTSKNLGQASVWYTGSPNPSTVPVPAAVLMLLTGLAGFGVLRRRKV